MSGVIEGKSLLESQLLYSMNFDAEINAVFFPTECLQRGHLHKVFILCMLLISHECVWHMERQLHSFSYPILQLFYIHCRKVSRKSYREKKCMTT